MADAVASGIVRMVFDKLGTTVLDELRSLKDVGEELKKLESTLSTIRNVLEDAEARQAKEKTLVDWLKKLKDVAYDIDDVLDEAAVEADLKHTPDQFKCIEMVRKCLSFLKTLLCRHEIATKMEEIGKRLDMISEEKSRFHLTERAAEHSHEVNFVPRGTGSYVEKSQVYGRDEDKKRIIDFLLNKCNEKNLGVIAIVGLGGLGKTTLARLVYNDDEQVSQHFMTKIWVYVSQKFDFENVIRSAIESLTERKFKLSSTDSVEQELLKQIKGKRFLLVLDDVWNEVYRPWERLESLLKNGAKGSKVIVTTRSTRVASVMKSDELHSLGGLPDDDCWRLFENNAFESDDDSANNRNLVAVGKEIVKKCGGLPLAAMALGSVLRFKREERQWREVRDNETWTQFEDNEDILPALMLSYNHLSPPLKQCFAYCSIFPKGTKIKVTMLAQLWVAEGFVGPSDGSQYVDQLKSRSLLENVDRIEVKMHDMVHNLAQFVAGTECSIVDARSGSSTSSISQDSRYTSLLFPYDPTLSIALIPSSGQKLRTFLLIGNDYRSQRGDICQQVFDIAVALRDSQVEEDICQKFLDTIFLNMKLLRALYLHGLAIKELPTAIEKLIHLRYLDLSWTMLKGLPQTIGLLHNLQTLKLIDTNLEALPKSIGDLVNLLTLDIAGTRLCSLPDTVGKLFQLQCLSLSRTDIKKLPPSIGTLHNLETLDLSYCEKLEVLPESIGGLANLLTLNLIYCRSLYSLPDAKNIQSMRSLINLSIDGCDNLASMPAGIGQLRQLQRLDMYVLGDGENSATLAELGTMMNLKGCLCIKNLQNVKDIAQASATNLREKQGLTSLSLEWDFDAEWAQRSYKGMDLTRINYEFMDNFENKRKAVMERVAAMDGDRVRLIEDASRSLQPHQNLQYLKVTGYVGKTLPGCMMGLPVAPNLVDLHLQSFARCDNLQALEQLSCLERLVLNKFPFIECLPRLGQLPRLTYLTLYMLPNIKCLGSKLYGGAGAFPALKGLTLQFMLSLEEWSGINPNDGGDDFLSRLSSLDLRDCPKLRALPSTTFPFVKVLTMNADDELLVSYLGRSAFPNLKSFYVYNCIDEDESSLPEALVQCLPSVKIYMHKKLTLWNHSWSKLEMMRLETLERIATEVEKKLGIKPSS